MTGADHLLDIRSLKKTFNADAVAVRALRGVDLSMRPGEFVAITGPSGCGKSTLLNLIAGLDTPSDGEIRVAGEVLTDKNESSLARMRRRHIGFVFQFFQLIEGMAALENVVLPAVLAGARRRQATQRAHELLDLVGLVDKRAALPGELSGGERQRVAIARALANRPTLVLADEPTGALDSVGAAEILELLSRLHASGQAILLVTHDRRMARRAQRTLAMRDGRIEPAATAAATTRGDN